MFAFLLMICNPGLACSEKIVELPTMKDCNRVRNETQLLLMSRKKEVLISRCLPVDHD